MPHRIDGGDNQRIKQSIQWLAKHDKLSELRLLVLPQHSDHLEHVDELAQFITTLGDIPVRLTAFHHHGGRGAAEAWETATKADYVTLAAAPTPRGGKQIIRPALYL